MIRTAAPAGMALAAIVALYGCAAHHVVKPLPANTVVAMPPIPNPPLVTQKPRIMPTAPLLRQYDEASKKALEFVVQPDTDAGVIKALRGLDEQARNKLRDAEKHPDATTLRRAHEAVSALNDYLETQGVPVK